MSDHHNAPRRLTREEERERRRRLWLAPLDRLIPAAELERLDRALTPPTTTEERD